MSIRIRKLDYHYKLFSKTCFKLLAAALLCPFFLSGVRAQQAATTTSEAARAALKRKGVRLDVKQQSLQALCVTLSQQMGRSILVDGVPVKLLADLQVSGTGIDALDALAGAFDYNWTVSSHNVILLRKRFQSQDELPQMHWREWERAARDIMNVLDTLHSDMTHSAWLNDPYTFLEFTDSGAETDAS